MSDSFLPNEAKQVERDAVVNPAPRNRALDVRITENDSSEIKLGLYEIDKTILDYIRNVLKPIVKVNNEVKAVPVVFANQERWKAIRIDGVYRDTDDKIQTPLIVIGRPTISRDQRINIPVNKYMTHLYEKRWNSKTPYDKFNALNGIKAPREFVAVTVPDYVNMSYEIMIWTSFQEQMNGLVELFNFESDDFWGQKNQFKFKTTIDDFQQDDQLPADSDRVVRVSFNMRVEAYLLSDRMIDKNKKMISTMTKVNSAKKAVLFFESETDILK